MLRVLTLDFVTYLFVHVGAQIANYNISDVNMLIVSELFINLKISMLLGIKEWVDSLQSYTVIQETLRHVP